MQKYRIEGLSDIVFGLALSIGSLAMINQNIDDTGDVAAGIFWFVFGFIVLVNVWISYTKSMEMRNVETKLDFGLNIFLLLLVSIEPYLLYILGKDDPNTLEFASTAYAIDIGLIMLVLGLFYHKGIDNGNKPKQEGESVKELRDRNIFIASMFLISGIPFFYDIDVFGMRARYFIWILALLPGFLLHFLYRRSSAKSI